MWPSWLSEGRSKRSEGALARGIVGRLGVGVGICERGRGRGRGGSRHFWGLNRLKDKGLGGSVFPVGERCLILQS